MAEAKRFGSGCVASPQYLASAAGLAVLARGGNAFDAALATNLTLGVVAPYMCGYGGDLFTIIWKDGELHAYNGSGRAASAATPDAVRAASGSDTMPNVGPHSVTVPGAVEGWFTLLERFGTMSFGDLARQALIYARDGFPLSNGIIGLLDGIARVPHEPYHEGFREIYESRPDRAVLKQPGLARTIQALIDDGPDAYYRGPIADAIAEAVQIYGGLLAPSDLAEHHGNDVDLLSTVYRGVEVFEHPPNSQGLTALEALNIVEGFEIGSGTDREHLLIEAMRFALLDRDEYLTDIDHMTIDPSQLVNKAWADKRRAEIDLTRAATLPSGTPAGGGTIYLCAADEDGTLVSLIQSNYKGFGSQVSVAEWGINLQNRGGYFSLDPSRANVIAPGKRTLHTLMPAMAFRDGRPWLVFGTMGGDGQAQTHLQFLSHVIDGGADIQQAIDAPRWCIEPADWSVLAESRFPTEVLLELEGRGHAIQKALPYDGRMGHAHAIEVRDHGYACATDPRADGAALGI